MTSKAKHRQIGERQGLERFLVATGLNTFGDVISTIALPIIAFQVLGGSVFEVAALVAVEQVAWLLVGLPVGVWVDRFSRKHVLVLGGVLRATLLGLIPLSCSTGWLDMSLLFLSLSRQELWRCSPRLQVELICRLWCPAKNSCSQIANYPSLARLLKLLAKLLQG